MRKQFPADDGFERYRKPTRPDLFLAEMDQVIPWRDLCEVIKPYYPKPKSVGRPLLGLERMLRIHFLQHWLYLSDPAVEGALYDSRATRRFVDIDIGRELAQDDVTICKLRHLLHLDGMRVSGGSAYAGQGDIGDWTRTPTGCLWHVDWSIVYGATTVAATT